MPNLVIMKFGGTSLGSAERIQSAADIVSRHRHSEGSDIVVVVSAMSGVTNLLVNAAKNACGRNRSGIDDDLKKIRDLHYVAVDGLRLQSTTVNNLNSIIDQHLISLRKLLESIFELGEITPRAHDLIVSFGERISIHLMASALSVQDLVAEPIESSKLIVTNDNFGSAVPILDKSSKQTKSILSGLLKTGCIPVVTGFIGATEDGIISTLGRGGSDYSATILGYCLGADVVEIWTDVNGVMSADPRIVKDAHTIDNMSYDEASELSYFGSKVLHPLTMVPAIRKNTPIWIKNSLNPNHVGTKISAQVIISSRGGKAISVMKNVSLITLQGRGMLGVPGIAGRVFTTLASNNINVLLISQASAQYNITFIVSHADGKKSVKVLQEAFRTNLIEKLIESISIKENLAIVATVGEEMKGHFGVAGTMFSALGDAKINISAISQGSSERNISLVVKEEDADKAVINIHRAFGLGMG